MLIYVFLAFMVNDTFQDKKYLYSDEKHENKDKKE